MSIIPTMIDRVDAYRIYCSPCGRLPLGLHAGPRLGDLSLLDVPRLALPRRPALNGWLVTARDSRSQGYSYSKQPLSLHVG